MKNDFRELTAIKSAEVYEVYKYCMYLPTKGKYDVTVDGWLKNENIWTRSGSILLCVNVIGRNNNGKYYRSKKHGRNLSSEQR